MHINSLCGCWHLEAVKGSSSLPSCRLLISPHITSYPFPCPGSTDAPCSRLWGPVPPSPKMAPPFTGSAHTPSPGSMTSRYIVWSASKHTRWKGKMKLIFIRIYPVRGITKILNIWANSNLRNCFRSWTREHRRVCVAKVCLYRKFSCKCTFTASLLRRLAIGGSCLFCHDFWAAKCCWLRPSWIWQI